MFVSFIESHFCVIPHDGQEIQIKNGNSRFQDDNCYQSFPISSGLQENICSFTNKHSAYKLLNLITFVANETHFRLVLRHPSALEQLIKMLTLSPGCRACFPQNSVLLSLQGLCPSNISSPCVTASLCSSTCASVKSEYIFIFLTVRRPVDIEVLSRRSCGKAAYLQGKHN